MLCLVMIQDSMERMMVLHEQITVKEYFEDSWSSWFDGLTISHAADKATTLAGPVRDQSALYGLIDKARDLGLTQADAPDIQR
jgi:ABC-type arginine/histidine transport system permease subunit